MEGVVLVSKRGVLKWGGGREGVSREASLRGRMTAALGAGERSQRAA